MQLDDRAFLVGGQALNLWAERYSAIEELAEYGPFTSKDIDYFGYREAAEKLAEALGGKVKLPRIGDATPQTAIVVADIAGMTIEIDFLNHVLGVERRSLQKEAVEICFEVELTREISHLSIPISHPLHCMQSRVANVITLGRKTELALRQLNVSPIIVRQFVSEMLDLDDHKHATETLTALFKYLDNDICGRKCQTVMESDPINILEYFVHDDRLDQRWRAFNLSKYVAKIRATRPA